MNETFFTTLYKWFLLSGYSIWIFLFDYLYIPKEATYLLALLLALDTVTWVLKVLRWSRQEFTSYELWLWVLTKLLTFVIILAAAILSKLVFLLGNIDIGIVHLLAVSIWIFWIAQFYSIVQNVYIFKTGKQVTELDAMTLAIQALQGWARKMLEAMIKNP